MGVRLLPLKTLYGVEMFEFSPFFARFCSTIRYERGDTFFSTYSLSTRNMSSEVI